MIYIMVSKEQWKKFDDYDFWVIFIGYIYTSKQYKSYDFKAWKKYYRCDVIFHKSISNYRKKSQISIWNR